MESSSTRKGQEMDINKIIRENWDKMDYTQLAKLTGLTAEAVRSRGRYMELPPKKVNAQNRSLTPEQEVAKDVTVSALSRRIKMSKSKEQVLHEQVADLSTQLEAMKVVGTENSYRIPAIKKSKNGQATAVAVASDWHIAESVHSENVNGLNEFTLKTAQERAEKFFQNVVKLVTLFQQSSEIDTLVLALLGDFINGQLREEAMENNSLRPMDEMLKARELLRAGIKFILDNTDVNLVIPCHSGNHARVTKKIHWSTESGNSLEYAMYHVLANDFDGDKRVKFIIPTSYHSYVTIGEYTIRFHHGHSIKYGGGIGGITISVNKAIAQWQKSIRANLDVFGHFHTMKDGGNFICNGSLIGYNEFAVTIKADFEKPKQTFFLIDHKRNEKTVTTPVFLE